MLQIRVLQSPLCRIPARSDAPSRGHAHGRAPQLRLWGLQADAAATDAPTLLVLAPGDLPFKHWLQRYHALCARLGPLPAPRRTVMVDHGAQRFVLVELPPAAAPAASMPAASGHQDPAPPACVAPALAYLDSPAAAARVAPTFEVRGWAFKEGVGLSRVEVTIDGVVVAEADYGSTFDVGGHFPGSLDPNQPQVGFQARIELPASQAGFSTPCTSLSTRMARRPSNTRIRP